MTIVPSPSIAYLGWAMILLLVSFLQYVFDIRGRFLQHRRLYAYLSYGALVIITIGIFGGLDYSGNVLMIRAANAGNSGHLISWIAIMLIFYRFGFDDILRGAGAAAGFIALHESISVFTTMISGGYGATFGVTFSTALWNYSTFFVLLAAASIVYVAFMGNETFGPFKKAGILLLIYSLVLVSIGGVGTINLLGQTPFFNNLDVNLQEQLSWIIPSLYLIGLSLSKKEMPPVPNTSKAFE